MKTVFILFELVFFGFLNGLALAATYPQAARMQIFFALPVCTEGFDDFLQTGGALYTVGVTTGTWFGAVL